MATTSIQWTNVVWNPSTGCTKISDGCKNCYAEKMAHRLHAMGLEKYKNEFKFSIHPETLLDPLSWRKHRFVFVNSMSDLFHENMPFDYLQKVFQVMENCPQHTFQILTKRDEILKEYSQKLYWPDNVWMGVTVESDKYYNRIDILRNVPAKIKFLSLEPLLSPLDELNLSNINWVIVGGESGRGYRPINKDWVLNIQRQCKEQNVPFFFKQWGGKNKKASGNLLDGKIYQEMPENFKVK